MNHLSRSRKKKPSINITSSVTTLPTTVRTNNPIAALQASKLPPTSTAAPRNRNRSSTPASTSHPRQSPSQPQKSRSLSPFSPAPNHTPTKTPTTTPESTPPNRAPKWSLM